VETGHCPETSRDANGYNRYYRIKVLPNVAGLSPTLYSVKAQQVKQVYLLCLSLAVKGFFVLFRFDGGGKNGNVKPFSQCYRC